jgi:hypothetical protein
MLIWARSENVFLAATVVSDAFAAKGSATVPVTATARSIGLGGYLVLSWTRAGPLVGFLFCRHLVSLIDSDDVSNPRLIK